MNEEYKELLKKAMEKMPKKVPVADRFQIPQVVSEIQGPRTIVRNFNEIVQVLRRESAHFAKYLTKELAVPGNIQGNLFILQGKFSREILQKKVENYVKGFVYCKVCGEPDTKLIKENRFLFMKCEACGAKSPAKS